MNATSLQEEYLLKGHNGLETCVALSSDPGRAFRGRKVMDREVIKDVLRRFNERGVRYCLVGGLAMAHHAAPRFTQDVDLMVLPEDMPLVGQLLKGHEQRGTAVVLIFQIGATRFDIIPANLRARRESVLSAIDDLLDEMPVKVVNLRHLLLLKMWAAPDRSERGKRMRDETDIVELIEFNPGKVSAEDIAYICQRLLAMCYTTEDVNKYRAQIEWLNGELEALGLGDRRYALQ